MKHFKKIKIIENSSLFSTVFLNAPETSESTKKRKQKARFQRSSEVEMNKLQKKSKRFILFGSSLRNHSLL